MMGQSSIKRTAASAKTRTRAKELRHGQTVAEDKLWSCLRNRALLGHKFRRQNPIEGFIVDFFCPDCYLIIEVDGPTHEEHREYDEDREDRLNNLGYRIVRFKNEEVLLNVEGVLDSIIRAIAESPHPNPLPLRGRGDR